VSTILVLTLGASVLYAHDLFIRLDSYFLGPNITVSVRVINGTFFKSENWITRDRVTDISMVTAAGRVRIDTTQWSASRDSLTTLLTVRTGAPDVLVLGASTKASDRRLEAADFDEYLKVDGIPDVLAAGGQNNELGLAAWERYAKHVNAIVQVGDVSNGPFDAVLGYPGEIVALVNPYPLRAGGTMRIRCLVNDRPVANQLVIVGGDGRRGPIADRSMRTDAAGELSFSITEAGSWFAKTTNMTRVRGTPELDFLSQWATPTFGVR
jgi:hypothetical protein